MTAHYRALIKTALVVGIVAIIFAIATVWPPILGWSVGVVIVGTLLFMIYIVFRMHEDGKDMKKRF